MDTYLKILELGLDTKTWADYIVEQTRQQMQTDPSGEQLTDIAAAVARLEEKVTSLKLLLTDYFPHPAVADGPPTRQYTSVAAAQAAFFLDEGFPQDTLLGKYYAVGSMINGYDIQFLTPDMRDRLQHTQPDIEVVELQK
jgi:hypothetical protein